jgi:hypothetical protein
MKTIRNLFLWTILSFFFTSRTFGAIEIVENNIQPPGEDEKRPIVFINCKSATQVMLPLRSVVTGKVFNENRTIVALNFHGVSNFDSADLLVEKGNKIFLIDDLYLYIEGDLAIAKILPTQDWNWMNFTVKSINKNKLTCQFRGQNPPNLYVEKTFSVLVDFNNDIMKFTIVAQGK